MTWEIVTELGTKVNIGSNHLCPEKTSTFYNPKMRKNRMLVLCALTAAIKERHGETGGGQYRRFRCLDAFGATGMMGLQWKKHHHGNVDVTVSDTNPDSISNIRRNCALNNLLAQDDYRLSNEASMHGKRGVAVKSIGGENSERRTKFGDLLDKESDSDEATIDLSKEERIMEKLQTEERLSQAKIGTDNNIKNVESEDENQLSDDNLIRDQFLTVVCCDAILVMRQQYFDFIHLDPYGCATPFMDSAFSNISNNGILSITSTDVASLYGKCPQVTLRNYGGRIAKCEYLKELSGRLVIAAATRAAARCNKGLEVLLCVALEHFVLVILRVRRGSGQADRSVQEIKHVLHCQVCGERTFVPNTVTVPKSMYDQLSCTCHEDAPGNTAMLLGPVWSGSIFDVGFIKRMVSGAADIGLGKKDTQLLHALLEEAKCNNHDDREVQTKLVEEAMASSVKLSETKIRSPSTEQIGAPQKRRKCGGDTSSNGQPAFYFSLSQHSIKNMDNPRIKKVIDSLHTKGFRASRTHFHSEGVRTDAGLEQFKAIMKDISTTTTKKK